MKKLLKNLLLSLAIFLMSPKTPAWSSTKVVTASWYDCKKKGQCSKKKIMANGKKFNPGAMTAAHKYLRLGTKVEVTNLRNGKRTVVTITDRGPYVKGRELDLSKGAAIRIGMLPRGLQKVKMRVLN